MQLALVSEKARSEFIVAPMLLAVRELTDPARQLLGECDFLLAEDSPIALC